MRTFRRCGLTMVLTVLISLYAGRASAGLEYSQEVGLVRAAISMSFDSPFGVNFCFGPNDKAQIIPGSTGWGELQVRGYDHLGDPTYGYAESILLAPDSLAIHTYGGGRELLFVPLPDDYEKIFGSPPVKLGAMIVFELTDLNQPVECGCWSYKGYDMLGGPACECAFNYLACSTCPCSCGDEGECVACNVSANTIDFSTNLCPSYGGYVDMTPLGSYPFAEL